MSDDELVGLALQVIRDQGFDQSLEWNLTTEEWVRLATLVVDEKKRRARVEKEREAVQQRARRLLRSYLTKAQRKELRDRRHVRVIGSAGGRYKLYPGTGVAYGCELHGTRWFGVKSYCLHDADRVMPPADVTLGQMLLLLSDEPSFLATANMTDRRSWCLWNGEWLRRLNRAKRERAESRMTA